MLKLKEEIKERGEDVVIYKHRSRLVFPIDTPEEDYPKWQSKGFNIFRCVECNSMDCDGNCTKEEVTEEISSEVTEEVTEEISNDKVKDVTEEVTEEISDEKEREYDMFTLKELRLFFPDIKAVSKKDFIKQIEEQ